MRNGDLLVALTGNFLQIRDARLKLVSYRILEGQVLDIAMQHDDIICLEKIADTSVIYVNVYSTKLKYKETLYEWEDEANQDGLVTSFGTSLLLAQNSSAMFRYLGRDNSVERELPRSEKPQSLCSLDEARVFATNSTGITLLNRGRPCDFFSWQTVRNMKQLLNVNPTPDFPLADWLSTAKTSFKGSHYGVLSKTTDGAGLHYVCHQNRVTCFHWTGDYIISYVM